MSQHEPPAAPDQHLDQPATPRTGQAARVVRRPRYLPFLVTGFVVGIFATAVLTVAFGGQVDQTRKLALYLGVLLAGLGALLGGALAVWLERDRVRR
jgi:H+/Cl- antiporter ClcA